MSLLIYVKKYWSVKNTVELLFAIKHIAILIDSLVSIEQSLFKG